MAAIAPPQDPQLDEKGRRRFIRRQRLSRWDVKFSPYLYISPFFVIFAIVGLFPLVYTAYVSLHDWNLIGGKDEFIGFENYQTIVQDPNFYKGLRNTFSIFILSSVPQVLAALGLAAVLDANLRSKTFWRMGVLLPYVVMPVAVGMIFSKIFADESGMANQVLTGIFNIEPIRWHADVLASHVAIATMVDFRWTGYNTLILLAAMQAVPSDLYEAAVVDGAGRFRQFTSITIPSLRPTIIFVVITSTIGGLQIFDEPRMFDQAGQGGNDRQWMTVTMYLYELGWGPQKSFGRAAAVAWILFLIILVIGMMNFFLTQRIAGTGSAKEVKAAEAKDAANPTHQTPGTGSATAAHAAGAEDDAKAVER